MGSAACGLLEMRSETAAKSAAVGFLGVGTWSYRLLGLPSAFILPLAHPCHVLGSITWAPTGSSSGEVRRSRSAALCLSSLAKQEGSTPGTRQSRL